MNSWCSPDVLQQLFGIHRDKGIPRSQQQATCDFDLWPWLPPCPVFFFLLVCAIRDSKVITCSASSAIKRQVHSTLINAQACTPAISSHERWNVLNATLQNKHIAVNACVTQNYTTWAEAHSIPYQFLFDHFHHSMYHEDEMQMCITSWH